MANTIGWGKGTQNNSNGWGKFQNTIGAASVYAVSYAGETALEGTAAFSNTKSIVFDGVDDYVDLGTGTDFNFTGSFTLSVWAKKQVQEVEVYLHFLTALKIVLIKVVIFFVKLVIDGGFMFLILELQIGRFHKLIIQ